jgi:hypothetical protein
LYHNIPKMNKLVVVVVIVIIVLLILLYTCFSYKESFLSYRGYSYKPYYPYFDTPIYPNYDNDGPGYGSFSRSDCQTSCKNNPLCKSYTYLNTFPGGGCLLHGNIQ